MQAALILDSSICMYIADKVVKDQSKDQRSQPDSHLD